MLAGEAPSKMIRVTLFAALALWAYERVGVALSSCLLAGLGSPAGEAAGRFEVEVAATGVDAEAPDPEGTGPVERREGPPAGLAGPATGRPLKVTVGALPLTLPDEVVGAMLLFPDLGLSTLITRLLP